MPKELQAILKGESAHAAPRKIVEGLTQEQSHREVPGAPHTIYGELWHISFWMKISLEWIAALKTPYPEKMSDAFPSDKQKTDLDWACLCKAVFLQIERAAAIARHTPELEYTIRCTSRPGEPDREMTAREQLESMAAHNSYHFGRIVLLRQMIGAWPPQSGGFSW